MSGNQVIFYANPYRAKQHWIRSNIATLSLHAQQQARQFITRVQEAMKEHHSSGETAAELPFIKIISGTRNYAEQNKLFRQGRYHNPGPIITNARGGSSAHTSKYRFSLVDVGTDGHR